MSVVKSEALVVKASDYSESTRLVTLLTPEHGRLRVLAKGIRRIKSRDRGALEPFSRVQVTLYLKDPDALGTLKESALLAAPSTLRNDYERWLLASLILEIIDRATVPAHDAGDLFLLVCQYLDEMETTDRPGETTLALLVAMLAWFGFAPSLDRCGVCGRDGPFTGFRIDKCGVTCERCAGGGGAFRPLPQGTIRVLEHLAADAPGRRSLRLSRAQFEQLLDLLVALLRYHLEISLTTARMLMADPAP